MSSQILLNVRPFQTRMACVEKGQLKQIFYHHPKEPSLVGAIYKGQVSQILGSFNFAFVDIGLKKGGFLYGKDLIQKDKKIENVLNKGQDILVQIKADPVWDKGAKLTAEISLPGFYLVYIPNQIKKIVFSRKIRDEKERERLTQILESFDSPHTLIVRTFANGKKEEDLKRDLENLQKQWATIQDNFKSHKKQGEIQKREPPIIEYLKNYIAEETKEILIDEEESHTFLKQWFKDSKLKELSKKLKKHSKLASLFKDFHIESQVERVQKEKVKLKNGGTLIFEELEAFVIVDVNTARNRGKKGLSESIASINMEAARMIAQQITLREMSGIILIDFIDMDNLEDRKKVVAFLDKELSKDKIQSKVFPMGELGLVQITRKRRNLSISHYLKEKCQHCHGEGRQKKITTIAGELLIQLEDFSPCQKGWSLFKQAKEVQVSCHTEVKKWIEKNEQNSLKFLNEKLYIKPSFVEDSKCNQESFKIKSL